MSAITTQKTGKIAVVLGARGGTGRSIVNRLCELSHEEIAEIRAVVRNNKSSTIDEEKASFSSDDRVKVLFGDVTDVESLHPAFTNAQYIFNASSGSGGGAKSLEQVDRDSVSNTAKLLAQEFSQSVERYVLVSSQLVHPSNKWHLIRIMLNTMVVGPFSSKGIMDYKWEGEVLLRNSGVPYTIVRPGRLINAPYPSGEAMKVLVGQTNVSLGKPSTRFDVAGVCIAAAMSEKTKNTTFEIGTEPKVQDSGEDLSPESYLSIPGDFFDSLRPRFLE